MKMFVGWRNHYISHVYVAITEYIKNHPEWKGTIFEYQMKEIQEAAKADYQPE